jgi:hypothetical protein
MLEVAGIDSCAWIPPHSIPARRSNVRGHFFPSSNRAAAAPSSTYASWSEQYTAPARTDMPAVQPAVHRCLRGPSRVRQQRGPAAHEGPHLARQALGGAHARRRDEAPRFRGIRRRRTRSRGAGRVSHGARSSRSRDERRRARHRAHRRGEGPRGRGVHPRLLALVAARSAGAASRAHPDERGRCHRHRRVGRLGHAGHGVSRRGPRAPASAVAILGR